MDLDDWMLDPQVFKELDAKWGPHTVDRFADNYNKQLSHFNSRFWSLGTETVDTFTCSWNGENNWWCPPVYLVPRVIQHAKETQAAGTLIVPCWYSAPFWPLIFPDGNSPAGFIHEIQELLQQARLFLPQRSGSVLFKGIPNTKVLALRLDFGSSGLVSNGD